MTRGRRSERSAEEWPRYTVKYTYGGSAPVGEAAVEEDDVVLFDPRDRTDARWIAAGRGSYVPLEETR